MSTESDAVLLARTLVSSASQMPFGQLVVEVVIRYVVDVRDGKLMGATMKELLPKVTIEQLRKSDTVIS